MRVALVYDRLNKLGGAEAVLVELAKLYPDADWYTSLWDPAGAPFSRSWRVKSSWLNHLGFLRRRHEWIPYLMPFVFESFDLSAYDLVISVGSAEAKGVITRPGTPHLHYCLTPTRYLYSHTDEYLTNPLYRLIAHYLRLWDQVASTRPDLMIAISTQVKKRIKKYYKRDVEIIYPPVGTLRFQASSQFVPPYTNYYLAVARLVPYKRLDFLVKLFNHLSKTLVIVGTGSEFSRLRRLAGPTVHLVGQVSEEELMGYYQHATAFLQANIEDFGIVMVEAQAAGVPVIAYALGGAEDIVKDGVTGILVSSRAETAWATAITLFEGKSFSAARCRQNAKRFATSRWTAKMKERTNQLCQTHA